MVKGFEQLILAAMPRADHISPTRDGSVRSFNDVNYPITGKSGCKWKLIDA
jgi:hypothetical protein